MLIDRVVALLDQRFRPLRAVPFDGEARFALITVNFSTTRDLQLMLATLAEQHGLHRLCQIVVVDNGSRDGGGDFLRQLAERVPEVAAVHNRTRLNHARGLRSGLRRLDRSDHVRGVEPNVVVFCDTDVIFRRPDTLDQLAAVFEGDDAVLAGELRGDAATSPDIQASFVAVRRDVLARRDVAPPLYSGSPLAWQQATVARLGLDVTHFPSNAAGFVLHRGRAGVAAAARFRPGHHYATVQNSDPHYMGVHDGEAIWRSVADRITHSYADGGSTELIEAVRSALSKHG